MRLNKKLPLPRDMKFPGSNRTIGEVEEFFAIWTSLSPEKQAYALERMEQMVRDQDACSSAKSSRS